MATIKHDPRVRLYVNSKWTDITLDRTGLGDGVRVDKGIEIFHGQRDEAGKPNPAYCKMAFGNKSGYFTPRNPMGPYAGYLNVNTPVCVFNNEVTDRFGRTSVNSWGNADSGELYSNLGTSGTAADFQVANGVGTHTVTTAATYRMSWFDPAVSTAPYIRNVVQKIRFTLPFTDVTVGAIEPANLLCRQISTTSYYMCRFVINIDETVSIAIHRVGGTGSATLVGATTVPGVTHVAGQGIWVMFGAIDNDLMATAWVGDDPEDEPQDWLITTTDTDPFLEFGWYGVRTGAAAGNTNVPFTCSYDNYDVWIAEFTGEIPDFNGSYIDSGGDAIVGIEAAGIARRLTEGSKIPFVSCARRWYEQFIVPNLPDWFWPLDDGELSQVGRATVRPNGYNPEDVAFIFDYDTALDSDSSNQKHFSQAKMASWLPNGVSLFPDLSIFYVALPDGTANLPNDRWAFDWTWTLGSNTQTQMTIGGNLDPGVTILGVGIDAWTVAIDTIAGKYTITPGIGSAPIDTFFTALTGLGVPFSVVDGSEHHWRLTAVQSGADINYDLFVDGVNTSGGTVFAHPFMASITTIQGTNTNTTTGAKNVGLQNIALWTSTNPTGNEEITSDAIGGNQGETAKYRFARLCNEENIENFIITTPDPGGIQMGPQYTDALMDQLFEIMTTDGGMLVEYMDARALNYLTLTELRALTVDLTIDVSIGQLAPPFRPIDDTQQLRNQVRASKRDGGDYVFSKEDGRLSIADPKSGGAGVYSGSDVKANVYREGQLVNVAQREVSEGTVDKARYPQLSVNLMAYEVTSNLALRRSILDIKPGKRIVLTGMADQFIFEDADLLVIGMTRFLTNHEHTVTWNTAPYKSYDVFRVETAGSIQGTNSTTIVDAIDEDDTTTRIITEGVSLWTTDGTYLPLTARFVIPPSEVTGEDISVTAVTTNAPSFRSVGAASHADNANTTPGLPAGQAAGDTLVLVTAIRNTGAAAAQPTGYGTIFTAGHLRVCVKTSVGAGEVAPTCTYTGGALGDTTSSFIMAFQNLPFGFVADSIADTSQTNASAQDIAYPQNNYTFTRSNGLELLIAWKQDDYTSVAVPPEYTEIIEASTVTGNDQSLYAAYRLVPVQDASPAGTLVVTGGAAAVSKAYKAYFANPQNIVFTRQLNGVRRSWLAGTKIKIAYPKVLG